MDNTYTSIIHITDQCLSFNTCRKKRAKTPKCKRTKTPKCKRTKTPCNKYISCSKYNSVKMEIISLKQKIIILETDNAHLISKNQSVETELNSTEKEIERMKAKVTQLELENDEWKEKYDKLLYSRTNAVKVGTISIVLDIASMLVLK